MLVLRRTLDQQELPLLASEKIWLVTTEKILQSSAIGKHSTRLQTRITIPQSHGQSTSVDSTLPTWRRTVSNTTKTWLRERASCYTTSLIAPTATTPTQLILNIEAEWTFLSESRAMKHLRTSSWRRLQQQALLSWRVTDQLVVAELPFTMLCQLKVSKLWLTSWRSSETRTNEERTQSWYQRLREFELKI